MDFRTETNRAIELMQAGNMQASGALFSTLYDSLRLDDYQRRLSSKQFDKVFFGLKPDEVLIFLLNKTAWHLNACETTEALDVIQWYKRIEKDFSIHGELDYLIDKDEIEAYCRMGECKKAHALCDSALMKNISHAQKVELLIIKGSIESDESHWMFGINSLSFALAEAEADGNPSLIAKCYFEMAKMIGTHYPTLSLSFLWKARVHYEKAQESENVAFCKTRMAMAYFLVWHKGQQREERFVEEARRLVNVDVKREDFRHPGAQHTFDRLQGLINNDLELIERSADFFESINAYGDFYISMEFYIKVCLTIGDREEAKKGAKRYEKTAKALKDQFRLNNIRNSDFDHAVACWCPEPEQKELPNLLDVLEMIAYDEEWFHLEKNVMRSLFPTHYQEGKFETVIMHDGKVRLYPCALYPYRYYRGQSDKLEGKKCQPSLFRGLEDKDEFYEKLCLKEFELLLKAYPLTKIFDGKLCYHTPEGDKPLLLNVDVKALGQHYGIKTDVLDLTADKWVAAFFATTEYKNKEYLPYKKEGEGVMYIYTHVPAFNETEERLSAVGLQPFSRPGCQAGLVYKMQKEEDFNEKAKRIVFKHDPAISDLIYNYCNRSKKLFPDEILEDKVTAIRESHTCSLQALTNTVNEYYQDTTEKTIQSYLNTLGITIQDAPPVTFTDKELSDFEKRWEKEKERFFESVEVRLCFTNPENAEK